jgi:hypothetical protein
MRMIVSGTVRRMDMIVMMIMRMIMRVIMIVSVSVVMMTVMVMAHGGPQ